MVKKIIFLIFITCIFILTACSLGGGRVLASNEDKKADVRMEQVLSAIKDKDKEAMKALFSKQALDENKDFDSGIDYLFSFFQGDVKSSKIDKWSSDESTRDGKESLMLRSWYTVDTSKEKYLFFIIDYTKDTINPDNEGLYTLRVIKAEDKETQFTSWQDMKLAGIYKPKE